MKKKCNTFVSGSGVGSFYQHFNVYSQSGYILPKKIISIHKNTPSINQIGKWSCNLKKNVKFFYLEVRFQIYYLLKPTEWFAETVVVCLCQIGITSPQDKVLHHLVTAA